MAKFKNVGELDQWREHLRKVRRSRAGAAATITIGMGTCGISAGARAVKEAVLRELDERTMNVDVVEVGCIGLCAQEPLLDIQQGAEPRVTYANVTPKMVPRIIQEHIVEGRVIDKWVFGRVQLEGDNEQ